MTPQTKNPHGLGAGLHKLTGWVLCNHNALRALFVLATLAAAVIWREMSR